MAQHAPDPGPNNPPVRRNRRDWAIQTLGLWLALGRLTGLRSARGEADDPTGGLLLRNAHPLDLETPVADLESRFTPNDRFFVRSHLATPAEEHDLASWRLRIAGLVGKPLELGLDDLKHLNTITVPAVLQCSGNGRAYYRPRLPGLAWDRGAVGNAEWTGVRLADVLKEAGLDPAAAHVHFRGADAPPSPKTPAYLRSIPISRALDPSTLLAFSMNGRPLPHLHGGPLRLIVPTWTANHSVKWLREITASKDEAPGFYQQTAYKMPKTPMPPDATPKPADLVPLTTMNVKSLITSPAEGTTTKAGKVEVRGVAWTGEGHVTAVEVATEPGPGWVSGTFLDPPVVGTWRRWRATVDAPANGPVVVKARATDSKGETQPEATPWNKSGYLWNGIDRVTINVG